MTGHPIVVVAIDAFEKDGHSVDEELSIFHFLTFEADREGVFGSGLSLDLYDDVKLMKMGSLGCPEGNVPKVGDFKLPDF